MEPFQLQPGEKLLVNDPHAVWMKGGTMTVKGQLKLTDRRLVFVKNPSEFAGPLKWFIKSLRSYVLMDFPLEKIKEVSTTALGKDKRITIDNGIERPRQFVTSKMEVLDAELKRMRSLSA